MAASDLRKAQQQLLYDLIEESNPGFKAQFPLDKIDFSAPVAKTPAVGDPYKRDTTVTVTAKAGSGFVGTRTISYRRIDCTVLFRNVLAQINIFGGVGATALPKSVWVAEINRRYGLATIEADWQSVTNLPSTTTYTLSVVGLCYKGTITVQWLPGKRPITDLIPDAKQVLVGRTYPAGNDFSNPSRKPIGEFELYGLDASDLKATLEALAASTVMAAGSTVGAVTLLVSWLNANSGKDYFSNADSAVKGGLCGLTWYKYTIPSVSVPEANSTRFTRVIVIQGVAGSWFSGKILLHYNP